MLQFWDVQFLNLNENRAYPLSESATRTDRTGTFVIPDSFLCALYLPVHAGLAVDPTNFFVRRLTALATGYLIAIGYDDGSDDPPVVTSAAVARAAHSEYDAYALPGVGDFDDVVGKVVVGRLDEIDLQPPGEYTFDPAGGLLDTDCVRPTLRGVSSLAAVNGPDASPRYRGDVRLVAGVNIEITAVGPGSFRIDAVDNQGLTAACACDGAGTPPPPIRTVNGVPPDAAGNLTLVGNKCLTVAPAANGLTLADACSEPCCGCPELAALTAELAHFGGEALALQNYVARLAAEVNQFNAVVLGSRLSDDPCVTC